MMNVEECLGLITIYDKFCVRHSRLILEGELTGCLSTLLIFEREAWVPGATVKKVSSHTHLGPHALRFLFGFVEVEWPKSNDLNLAQQILIILKYFEFYLYFQVDEEKTEPEVSRTASPGSDASFAPAKSLVQSVLEATAMRENEPELRTVSQMLPALLPVS